jgi:hypothetical protein
MGRHPGFACETAAAFQSSSLTKRSPVDSGVETDRNPAVVPVAYLLM